MLDHGEDDPREVLAVMENARPLLSQAVQPEDWTISVAAENPAWVIISQLADPEWTATWIGLEGQGEFVGRILPTFRKGRETGGWQRVRVPGPGRWTLRLEYQADDLTEGMAVSAAAWICWCVAVLVTGLKALSGHSHSSGHRRGDPESLQDTEQSG
jgi:hypothetical protein